MKPSTYCLMAGLVLLCCSCGCERNVYVVTMSVVNGKMERQLECWREDPGEEGTPLRDFPAEELTDIAVVYTAPVPEERKRKHVFRGVFADRMPCDVGGDGYVRQATTGLGSLTVYSERFRGDDDLVRKVENPQAAADRLLDATVGWLGTELGEREGWPALRGFLQTEFRHDVRNVALHAVLPNVQAQQSQNAEADPFHLARAAQYLVERGYVGLDEIPAVVQLVLRAEEGAVDEARAGLGEFLLTVLSRKLGTEVASDAVATLANLVATGDLRASFAEYLKTTPAWQQSLHEWEELKKKEPNAGAPDPFGPLEDDCEMLVSVLCSENEGKLTVRLSCPVAPDFTNGVWQDKENVVVWSDALHGEQRLPTFCYAVWSEPDRKGQARHFGRVVLQGKALAAYVMWYAGLDPARAREWDELVAGLTPGTAVEEYVGSFLFSDEQGGSKTPEQWRAQSAANPGRSLLLEACAEEAE